jgi:type I restriction enzyme S subunit
MEAKLPNGWKSTTLGSIADIQIGGTPARKEPSYWAKDGNGHAWASIADLRAPVVINTSERITDAGVAHSNVKLAKKGTILMSFKLTIGRVAVAGRDLYTNEAIAALIFDKTAHSDFFFQYMPTFALGGDAEQAVKGKTLNKGKLATLPIILPPIAEQQRIAKILTAVDDSIRAGERVIEQAERVKKGLMEELLTGGLGSAAIERGEVPEGWTQNPLASCVLSITGGVSVRAQNTPAEAGDIGVLKTSAVAHAILEPTENKIVIEHDEQQRVRTALTAESIIFSRMNTPDLVGANAYSTASLSNLFLPDRLWKIVSKKEKAVTRWLAYWMRFEFERGTYKALGTGTSGSMKNISMQKLKDTIIPTPPLVEQQRIASILTSVDDQIAAERKHVEQQKRLKQGLMDDLLTGRVRTM